MRGALYQVTLQVQELIRHPVERPAGMRAAVAVGGNMAGCTDQENIFDTAGRREAETATAAHGKVVKLTEFNFQRDGERLNRPVN